MGATKQQRKQAKKDGQAAKPTLGQALKPIIDALKQSLEDRD